MSTSADSKLIAIIKENLDVESNDILMTNIDRRYWADGAGHEHVDHLVFLDDLESVKMSLDGNYYATCCFGAVRYASAPGLVLTTPDHEVH